MEIIEHLQWRYATKKFDPEYILPDAKLQILKEAFNLTALSYGLQTLKLVIVKDKAKRESLVAHAFGQKQVADASHLLILCIQNEIDENDVEQHFDNIKKIRNTPEEILNPFKTQMNTTITNMASDKKITWATKQAYIALGNLMTVCAVEKIDSCPMEGFLPAEFDKAFGLAAKRLQSVLLLPVGKRAEDDMFAEFKKVRQPIHKTVIEL